MEKYKKLMLLEGLLSVWLVCQEITKALFPPSVKELNVIQYVSIGIED